MKNNFCKKIILINTFLVGIFFAVPAFAASLILNYPEGNLIKGQNYYADVLLDPEGKNINTISATINFSKNILPISYTAGTIVGGWIEPISISSNDNTIHFAGIIPGGFSGFIDPFVPNVKYPGKILRIYFSINENGKFQASSLGLKAYLNDGLGTETPLLLKDSPIEVAPIQKIPIESKSINNVYSTESKSQNTIWILIAMAMMIVIIVVYVIINFRKWFIRKKSSK